jgi:hypothetical protein
MSGIEPSQPGGYESLAETLRGLATLVELDPAQVPRVMIAIVFPDNTMDSFGNYDRETYRRILWTLTQREFEFAELTPKGTLK